MINLFLLFCLLIIWTSAFNRAPGIIILKIGIPELVDQCFSEKCQYDFDFCIGIGRSLDDRCLLMPKRNFSGYFSVNQEYLIQEYFPTENIRSSFYFNANFTFQTYNKDIETITFKDNLVHYAAASGVHRVSLHSEAYISMWIDINVTCDLGYYPPFQCTKKCHDKPGQYYCDINGSVVCFKGYVLLSSSGTCVKDMCKSNKDLCQNNSTCLNDVDIIRCACTPFFSGTACEIWDPCKEHQCKNFGTCVKNDVLKNYLCQCTDNYYGKYCENIEDPCRDKICPINTFCQNNYYEAICIHSPKSRSTNDLKKGLSSYNQISSTVRSHTIFTTKVYNSDIRSKETLIQHPVQRDFTIIIIVIFLLVCIICCFGIMFWIQLCKYFQKKIKYNNPVVCHIPPVINRQKHKCPEYNIQKWSSMDEGAFSLWRMSQNNDFSTLTYISGTNTKQNNSKNASLNKLRDFQSTFKTKKSNIHPVNDFGSKVIENNSCQNSEERIERMEDNDEHCLMSDENETQYLGVSFV